MKKTISFFLFLFFLHVTFAQQSAKDIATQLQQYAQIIKQYDNGYDSVYQIINKQIETQKNDAANSAIWHSCMAQLLTDYYYNNQYKILDRTQIQGALSDDFNVWDAATFAQQILFHYQQSLKNDTLLAALPIKQYLPLLDSLTAESYRPSLYDFLAFRYLDHLAYNHFQLPAPAITFHVNDSIFWANNEHFANIDITSPDQFSTSFLTLRTLQTLTKLHLPDSDFRALIEVTLRRFSFLANNSASKQNEELFLNVLQQMEQQYAEKAGYEMIAYALGEYHYKNDDYTAAVTWFEHCLDFAPESIEAQKAKNMLAEIRQSSVTLEIEPTLTAHQPNLLTFQYKNCEKLHFRIIPITNAEINILQRKSKKDIFRNLLLKKTIFQTEITLPEVSDYKEKSGLFLLPELNSGSYVFLVWKDKNTEDKSDVFAYKAVDISSLVGSYRMNDRTIEVLALDRITGKPLENVKVTIGIADRYNEVAKNETLYTNKEGFVYYSIPDKKNNGSYINIDLQLKDEKINLAKNLWNYYNDQKIELKQTHIFTDRNIYRPGQTVYYKGICVSASQNGQQQVSQQLAVNKASTIKLIDANFQIVDSVQHITNEYGSFSGSFVLPSNSLTGMYQLQANYNVIVFNVEEYKRPTFEVSIAKSEAQYKIDQAVDVAGNVKAYAGYGIDGAIVKYHVVRETSFPWWHRWWASPLINNRQEIANGTVVTNKNGEFLFTFVALPDLGSKFENPLYTYIVSVDVTDITGESHSAETRIVISKNGLFIENDIPQQLTTNHRNQFTVKTTNLAGVAQQSTLHYTISSLKMPAEYRFDPPYSDHFLTDSASMQHALPYLDFSQKSSIHQWETLALVHEGDFLADGNTPFSLPNLATMKEGYYKINFSTYDNDHNEIVSEQVFCIYNEKNNHTVFYTPLTLFSISGTTAEVGSTAEVMVSSYLKESYVLCEIISNNQLVKSQWIKLNQGKALLEYPITEKNIGHIVFHAHLYHNNKSYTESVTFDILDPHQEIVFDFLTFRDKTLPGSEEQCKIRLHNKAGDKVAAELLCSMYDASLDAFRSNTFNDNIFAVEKPLYNYDLRYSEYGCRNYFSGNVTYNIYHNMLKRYYPELIFLPHSRYSRDFHPMFTRAKGEVASLNGVSTNLSKKESVATEYETLDFEEMVEDEAPPVYFADVVKADDASAVRSNFAETAFFYPHLNTDENGDVLITFTMPQSLTRWRMQGFAHNTNLMSGIFSKYVQTNKKVMIVPNAPRFLREGDTLVFSAKVVNMDSVPQCGNVTLSFRDAVSQQALLLTHGESILPFEVLPNESQEVHFTICVPHNLSAVTYRIIASNLETPTFSDGEENTLPVLTNRILVTETLPLYVGKGSKTFTMEQLKNTLSDTHSTQTTQSLTLEFTPNPIWYAIQSMPYLMEYPYECNEQLFSRYYANILATHIVKQHPRIEAVFNEWQNSSPDAFCSQLEKNSTLKSILLEETPWVIDAQDESARKQDIALLFDFQRMEKEEKSTIKKLQSRQNGDGGWSWFPEGKSSCYITEHILAGIGHLNALEVPTHLPDYNIRNALKFIDHKTNEYYNTAKKNGWQYDESNIHYLYARSFFLKNAVSASHKECYNYYYGNLKKAWKEQSIYMQAMTALICYRNGDKALAEEIITSIKSKAQYSEELGMYWKKEGYGYYWYEAPVERQALLIEAFHTITKDNKSVEKMQQWLLQQKQTQSWSTTRSTTEAIYALLLNNHSVEENAGVTLALGNWLYSDGDSTESAEAGSGYLKKCWTGNDVTANMATVKLEKKSNGPAWGGLYWQYFDDLHKVEQSGNEHFSLQKRLYRVTLGERGEVLTPITEEQPINVGDKVRVRVEIRTHRDMEYIHLKDLRAACFEPVNVFSGYRYQGDLYYYQSTRDAATNFFIDYLHKGTHVFEYTLVATMAGTFSNGLTSIQCMYAPEFTAHSEGTRVHVR